MPSPSSRIRGCLLGLALGDALGAPIEFETLSRIRAGFGQDGPDHLADAYGRPGLVTDDTQMTLFTAEGMLRAAARARERGICHPPSVLYGAYQRWLHTQGVPSAYEHLALDGWLVHVPDLHHQRAPGSATLRALRAGHPGSLSEPLVDVGGPYRYSKGCGGVMRVAPVGLFPASDDLADIFRLGCQSAALTHGHPSGYLPAGVLAVAVYLLTEGRPLHLALMQARRFLPQHEGYEETTEALDCATTLAETSMVSPEALETLGGGWTGHEALAIAVAAVLEHPTDARAALRLSVTHSGDSDSTGAIAGALIGAALGEEALPQDWLAHLELRSTIERIANDLTAARQNLFPIQWQDYPGH